MRTCGDSLCVARRDRLKVWRGAFRAPILRTSCPRPFCIDFCVHYYRVIPALPFVLRMSTPVFRRLANPLSIWMALLAIVLQSVMPMVAQARMHKVTLAVVSTASAHVGHSADQHAATAHVMPAGEGVSSPASTPANPHAMHGDAPCPYCRVHLDAVALPLLPNPHWVMLVSVVHRAVDVEALPARPDAWSPTRPRGPPVLS